MCMAIRMSYFYVKFKGPELLHKFCHSMRSLIKAKLCQQCEFNINTSGSPIAVFCQFSTNFLVVFYQGFFQQYFSIEKLK